MEWEKHPSSKRYPPEIRERAVRLVFEAIEQTGERYGHVPRIAKQLGIGPETLRTWVRQAEIDGAGAPASPPRSAGGSPSSSGRTGSSGGPTRS